MRVAEELTRTELESFAPVEDLIRYYEDFGLTFEIKGGRLVNYFCSEGLSVLEDRQ